MIKKFALSLIIALFVALPVCAAEFKQFGSIPEVGVVASDGNYVTVIAQGQGISRANALEQAWIEAVRLAVGAIISSRSELNNDEFAENTIAHSRGVIENFDIIDEQSDGRRVMVTIQARVRREILMDAAKIYSEAQIVKAQTEGAVRMQMDLKAQDRTADDMQKSGAELLKEVLDAYGPEMFYSATLDPKVNIEEKTRKPYVIINERFDEDIFWNEFLPKLRQVLEGVAVKKEKKLYSQRVQDANRLFTRNNNAKGLSFYFGGELRIDNQRYDLNNQPYSWATGTENIYSPFPTGGFLFDGGISGTSSFVAVIIPDNRASYTIYYLDRAYAGNITFNELKKLSANDGLMNSFVEFIEKMNSRVSYLISYFDGQGRELDARGISSGEKMIGIYRSFFIRIDPELTEIHDGLIEGLNRRRLANVELYNPIIHAFSFTPGYVGSNLVDLYLSSSTGYYIDLDADDLQKIDSIKLECIFEK